MDIIERGLKVRRLRAADDILRVALFAATAAPRRGDATACRATVLYLRARAYAFALPPSETAPPPLYLSPPPAAHPPAQVKEYELKKANFSNLGHFGFGISEHIDLGVKYDPSTGIFGMDFYVVLGRPGFRVARRKHQTARIGAQHRIGKEEAQKWFCEKFEGLLV